MAAKSGLGPPESGQLLKVGSALLVAVRAARRVIKVTGAHSTIKTAPRMTKLRPAPQWSAMLPTSGGMTIAARRLMVCRSPTTEP